MRIKFFAFLCVLCVPNFSTAQSDSYNFWTSINEKNISSVGVRQIYPSKYKTFSLTNSKFKENLFSAPNESKSGISSSSCILTLPLPNGQYQRFRVVESPIMEEELALSFNQIKTFSIRGIDNPYASGKLDWTEFGFHAMVFSPEGDFFIDPFKIGNLNDYQSYYTSDFSKPEKHIMPEAGLLISNQHMQDVKTFQEQTAGKLTTVPAQCVGANLKTYRLAVACTGQYAAAATSNSSPSTAQILSAVVTSVNRVDGVYEKEVSVRLVLVATTTLVLYPMTNTTTSITPAPSATAQPFTGNNNAGTLIGQSQNVITTIIGSANFDIGHTFSTGGGGLAMLGSVCKNNEKASGITGSSFPVGDPYDIDYVAHEIGHQFGGNHTFNATTDNCNGNRNGSTSMEPGSGVTVMGYAGICSVNNIINNSIPYFHAVSYDEIVNFVNGNLGNSCAVTTTTGNQPPVVSINNINNYFVPVSTAFYLTGTAIDPDGDAVTYSWEEMDSGSGGGGNWNSGNKPFFRSYAPSTSGTRFFPISSVAHTGNYTGTRGEYMPQSAQVLNFRLTARDNKMGGGGVCYAATTITVDAAGPLLVTYPSATSISWYTTSQKTITWDVNGTDGFPISCDSVRILISNNSGGTYSVLVNSTPNDGSEMITVPTVTANIKTCRIKIESIGNVFYDIGNNNFEISLDPTADLNEASQLDYFNLSVWPNPSSNSINIRATGLNNTQLSKLEITDILGRKVFEKEYSKNSELETQLNVSMFNSGLYFIKLTNEGKMSVYRFIKD